MPEIDVTTGLLKLKEINIYMEDHGGEGRPVLLIHGWPLSGASWKYQIDSLLDAGYRVITYDRRGFGMSDKPKTGYDYGSFTEDLSRLIEELDLKDVTLVGFSMGGGEVAHYVAQYGEDRLHSIVLASAVTPMLLKTPDNPDGPLTAQQAAVMIAGLTKNEDEFYDGFLRQFFSPNADGNLVVTEAQLQEALAQTKQADKVAALLSMQAFGSTDFREDLTKITVPALVIHGDSDGIVLFEGSGVRTHKSIAQSEFHVIVGGPHGINVSHAEEFNRVLVAFLGK